MKHTYTHKCLTIALALTRFCDLFVYTGQHLASSATSARIVHQWATEASVEVGA
jgi:hypothetical protein